VLRQWLDPGCCLALWQRALAPDVVRRLDRLLLPDLPEACFITAPVDAGRKISACLMASRLRDVTLAAALARDMTYLVSLFATTTRAEAIEVRVEAIAADAYRVFHTDATPGRLVTTYIGPGTVWVPPRHAAVALQDQDAYRGPVFEMPRFAVGMFAGDEAKRGALVHRAPRLAGTGDHRLFFCLDRPRPISPVLH
jgi:hypothetical protein